MNVNVDDGDRVKCDKSEEALKPERTWDSKDPATKQPRRYGIIPLHHHVNEEREESGHVRQVFREDKKETYFAICGPSDLYISLAELLHGRD